MNSAGLQDWVFWLSGALLALAGLTLAAWALFWDCSRGRKRCPKCWYDMSGAVAVVRDAVEVFVCPECGRKTAGAPGLLRTHRRLFWGAVGGTAIALSYAVAKVPEIKRRDWTALVPTSVLVFVAGATDVQVVDLTAEESNGSTQSQVDRVARLMESRWRYGSVALSPSEALEAATWSRLESGQMWRWQSQVYLGRYLTRAGKNLSDALVVPKRWVAGEPMPVLESKGFWLPIVAFVRSNQAGADLKWPLIRTPARPGEPICENLQARGAGGSVLFEQQCTFKTVLVATQAEALEALDSPDATDQVRVMLNLRILESNGTLSIAMDDRADNALWHEIDFGVVAQIEVVLDGETVGRAVGKVTWNYVPWEHRPEVLATDWASGARQRLLEHPDRAKFAVSGDRAAAWELYREWPFSKPRAAAWAGKYDAPVWIEHSEPPARPAPDRQGPR